MDKHPIQPKEFATTVRLYDNAMFKRHFHLEEISIVVDASQIPRDFGQGTVPATVRAFLVHINSPFSRISAEIKISLFLLSHSLRKGRKKEPKNRCSEIAISEQRIHRKPESFLCCQTISFFISSSMPSGTARRAYCSGRGR